MNLERTIEKFGNYFTDIGLSKTYGRLFGYFLTTQKPVSMSEAIEQLQISKSTASIEIRKLLAMGIIEKALLPLERADFYQLRQGIWEINLNQKILDIKKLRSIVDEVPFNDLQKMDGLKGLSDYCTFIEGELEMLVKKYATFTAARQKTGNTGRYFEKDKNGQSLILEWYKLSALSEEFSDKMASVADLGIESFRDIEIDFLASYPQAIQEDKGLTLFEGLKGTDLEKAMETKLHQIFHMRPENLNEGFRALMAEACYYFVTIREEGSEKIQGFIAFLSGGPIPNNEFKITVLAVDKEERRKGLAGFLVDSLGKIGIPYKKMRVCTRPSNTSAIHFYKKMGFIEDLEEQKNAAYLIPGHWIHLLHH